MILAGLSSLVAASIVAGPVYDPGPVRPEDGTTPAEIEVSRIQRHLRHVEQTLRANPPEGLSDAQQRARSALLDDLHAYWQAGEFPKNRDYPDRRVPYFIDDDGVACAVGYLMITSDGEAIAREIATYENNDFVAEIEHPEVPTWLQRNGLETWEAAWIQPSYGPCGFEGGPLVCGTDGNTYLCESIAVNCAGVEVEHEGPCGDPTGTGTGSGGTDTGDPGPVIGEEICMGTGDSTAGEATTDGAGSGTGGLGNTSGGVGSTGAPMTSSGSGTGDTAVVDDASGDDEKGCACSAGRDTSTPWTLGLAMLGLLGLRRGRRRRR